LNRIPNYLYEFGYFFEESELKFSVSWVRLNLKIQTATFYSKILFICLSPTHENHMCILFICEKHFSFSWDAKMMYVSKMVAQCLEHNKHSENFSSLSFCSICTLGLEWFITITLMEGQVSISSDLGEKTLQETNTDFSLHWNWPTAPNLLSWHHVV
jgi:hypothetical protein